LAALPGLVIAATLWRILREPDGVDAAGSRHRPGNVTAARSILSALIFVALGYAILETKSVPLILGVFSVSLIVVLAVATRLLRSRNIAIAMVSLVCGMSCIFVLGGFYPDYLNRYLHVGGTQAGLLMSALGFGGFAGEVLSGVASDYMGRKWTTLACFVGAAATVYALIALGSAFHVEVVQTLSGGATTAALGGYFWLFYGLLFTVSLFTFGVLTIMTGPVPSESVHPTMIATAIGFASGTGEIFGAGVGPPIAGYVADTFGIENILFVGLGGLIAGTCVVFFLKETAPRRVSQAECFTVECS
jgi:predicted MFS family arabinose efflux permease